MTGVSVRLTDEELVLLDGRCSGDVQAQVDVARQRLASRAARPDLSSGAAELIADAVAEARASGVLVCDRRQLSHCRLCDQRRGHVAYKSGPRKGEANFNRPLYLPGIELARRSVFVQGHVRVGGCVDCVDPLLAEVAEALRGVPAEVPAQLRADGEPMRKRHSMMRCTRCAWEGHEGEMIWRPTLLGDGTYPSGCPANGCDAANVFLSRQIETVDGFAVVEVEQ